MQKQKREKINNQVILIVVTLILAVFLAGDLIGLGGNLRYYANWIMCGHKPLVVDHPLWLLENTATDIDQHCFMGSIIALVIHILHCA